MAIRAFGELDGEAVHEIAIRSAAGAEAYVITYGAAIRDLRVPLRGGLQRVVLGLNSVVDYRDHSPYFGVIAGRVANRIAHGLFRMNGQHYQLPLNEDGRHTLHGGPAGFGKRVWQLADHDATSVTLMLFSPDGDQGFPGALSVTCVYRLIDTTLRIELAATSDAATAVNLCHHSYFNLDGSPSILDHALHVAADFYTPTDDDLIPTGEIRDVSATPYDFRAERSLRLAEPRQRPFCYDINFVLRRDELAAGGLAERPLARAARLCAPDRLFALSVWTTEPGLQVYDGSYLDLPVLGLDGQRYGVNAGICLEPQHFPDAPNRPHFPPITLRPHSVYRQITEYRFLT